MKVYLIPGLGYDCRIFERLNLEEFDVTEMNWIEPKANEKIHHYAQRMFPTVMHPTEKIVLIGHSLGGIVSQEIASVNQIEKVILISSIQSREEIPLNVKLIKPFRISKLFTKELSLKTVKYWGKSHGFETESDKDLFRSMVGKHTNVYLQWALRELSSWHEPNISSQTEIIHIHGTNDKTLPYKLVKKPDFTIEHGSHICVLKKAEKVSEIIKNAIQHLGG